MRQLRNILLSVMVLSQLFLVGCTVERYIDIGFIGTLTGKGSDLTVSGRRGAELAVEEINKRGGINGKSLRLVFQDDKNDITSAIQGINELMSQNVQFAIGPFTSGISGAMVEHANANQFLLLSPTVSADKFTGIDDYFIRYIAATDAQALILAEVVFEKGHGKVMVAYDQNNAGFSDALVENFELILEKTGQVDVLAVKYDPNAVGAHQDIIQKLSAEQSDALLIIASAEECATFAKEIKQSSPTIQLYGPLWANTNELIRKGGVYVEGMILVGGIDLNSSSQAMKDFTLHFYETYGEYPTFASLYTYDAILSLDDIQEFNAINIKKNILTKGFFTSLDEKIAIDAYGDCMRSYLAFQVQDGEMVRLHIDESR